MSALKSRLRLGDGAAGLRNYTRGGQYLVALAQLLTLGSLANALRLTAPTSVLVTIVVLALLHTGATFLMVRTGFEAESAPAGTPTTTLRRVALAGYSTGLVAWIVFALTAVAGVAAGLELGRAAGLPAQLVIAVGAYACATLGITVPFRRLWPAAFAVAVLGYIAEAGAGGVANGAPLVVALVGGALTLIVAGVIGSEMWYLRVVNQLDAARETEARLAVAEERLRFSRDLHDVVGQALSAIAIKSDIAAQLARRGDERAVDIMTEVRALAHDSLREARGVVTGYRRADLATEIIGARSLLNSAGATTAIVGNPCDVPADLQDAFAWVAREAVTNVVRHSAAERCSIVVGADNGGVYLRVTNDGVAGDPGSNPGGTGVIGMRERLADVGGSLTTTRDGEGFVVEARAPLRAAGRSR